MFAMPFSARPPLCLFALALAASASFAQPLRDVEAALSRLDRSLRSLESQRSSLPAEVFAHELQRLRFALGEVARSSHPRVMDEERTLSEVSDEDLSVRMKSLLRNTLRTRKRLERASDAFDDPPSSRSSSLTAGPSLGGRVTNAGRGVEGVMVRAVDEEGGWLRTVLTDAQGYYSLPVSRADAMTVSTVNHQGLVDQTRRASPSTQTIEFALAAGGTLSGTVLETGTLAPAANAAVFVLEMTQILGPDTLTSVATAFTAADGTFTTFALPPGEYYLMALGNSHGREFWPDVDLTYQQIGIKAPVGAQAVTVEDGDALGGFDFTLTPHGTASGRVTEAATGDPVSGAEVTIVPRMRNGSGQTVLTDAGGFFVSNPMVDGPYEAAVVASGLVQQCWEGHDGCDVFAHWPSDGFAVANGEDTSGVDFALKGLARLSGTVTMNGVPADGTVSLFEENGDVTNPVLTMRADGGTYDELAPPGRYYVVASHRNNATGIDAAPELYPDLPCAIRCDKTRGELFVLDPGDSEVLDFALETEAILEVGVFSDEDGSARRSPLSIFDANGGRVGYGQAWAIFPSFRSSYSLPPGDYLVRTEITDLRALNEVFDDVTCPGTLSLAQPCDPLLGTPVSLSEGNTTSIDIDVAEVPPGSLGDLVVTVLDADGNPTSSPQDPQVRVFDLNGQRVRWQDLSGGATSVTIPLPAGLYYVAAWPRQPYDGVVYPSRVCSTDSECTLTTADPVRVRAGRQTEIEIRVRDAALFVDGFEKLLTEWTLRAPE